MAQSPGFLSKLVRLSIALGLFIGALFVVLYIGFEAKFQSPQGQRNSSGKPASDAANQLFYQSIGSNSRQLGELQTRKAAPVGEKFTIELQVFQKKELAEELITTLEKKGIRAYYTPFSSQGRIFFRVRYGIYDSKMSAEDEAQRLKTAQNLPVTVVQLR